MIIRLTLLAWTMFAVAIWAGEDESVEKMAKSPNLGYGTQRPGWISVDYDDTMLAVKARGKEVWVELLKKIGQLDNTRDTNKVDGKKHEFQEGEDHEPFVMTARKAFLLKVSVIAADLEIKELVPVLFSYLEDKDDPFSDILAVHIGTILKLPDLYHYHRHWFNQEERAKFREAVAERLKAK